MRKVLAFLNAHKTKITGSLLVIAGSLQANASTVQSLVSPKQFAWGTVAVGVLVGFLGFLNSQNK